MQFLLLRHATAADAGPGLADFDRPLTAEGGRQADRIGRLLGKRGLHPDAIVSSPALRALQTAQRAAAALGVKPAAIELDPRIYEAVPPVLIEILGHVAARHERPMLVGHNPGFDQLAKRFGGPAGREFPKAGAALFEATDSTALRQGGCRFLELLEA
jgi:phosphohistidine phosphatase